MDAPCIEACCSCLWKGILARHVLDPYGVNLILKFILLAVIAWLVYRLLKGYAHSVEQDRPVPPPTKAEGEDMVRCVECGVHLPRSESILSKGEFFCCEAHRQKHQH